MTGKPLKNSSNISYQNINGIVSIHDGYLNQGVKKTDSPTFANLNLTGNATIEGNLYVEGNTSIFNTEIIEFEDNILLLNRIETGPGVTLNQSGLEVNRGTLENFRAVYNEPDNTYKIGLVSNLQAVAVREDNPLNEGIMVWNNTERRIDSTNTINIDVIYNSTTNSMYSTSGSVSIRGGLGISKDVTIDGKTQFNNNGTISNIYTNNNGDLSIEGKNIDLRPSQNVNINNDIPLFIGNSNIKADSASSNLVVSVEKDLNLNLTSGNKVTLPNEVSLALGNNMIVSNTQDNLILNIVRNVILPVNKVLAFEDTRQSIQSDTSNNLILRADQNINITPGINKDIILPVENGIKFGTSRILQSSSGKVTLTGSNGNIPTLEIKTSSNTNSRNMLQFITNDTTEGYYIGRTTEGNRILNINIPGHQSYNNIGEKPKFNITSQNSQKELLSVESDTGNISSIGAFDINNTNPAVNSTTASFVLRGGLGIVKNIISNGAYQNYTTNINALNVNDTNGNVYLNVDTVNNQTLLNTDFNINNKFTTNLSQNSLVNAFNTNFTNTTDSINTSSGAVSVSGGMSIVKKLQVGDTASFYNNINMNDTLISNLKDPINQKDAATKAYVDLVKQGLYVKDSVSAATFTTGNLATDYVAGSLLDNYILKIQDRILIKDQTNKIENGIYVVTNGAPMRAIDLQNGQNASGIFVFVRFGDINGTLGFICNTPIDSDIVGTSPLNFTQFTGLGNVDAGAALSKIFNQLNVNTDNFSIEIQADALRLSSNGISIGLTGGSGMPLQTTTDQSHVTKLGTINTGIWEANTISVKYGGTGNNSFTSGNILFGSDTDTLSTSTKLFFDSTSGKLGVNTNNNPSSELHVNNDFSNSTLTITSLNNKSVINLNNSANITLTKNASDTIPNNKVNSLLINNSVGSIEFATNNIPRIVLSTVGNTFVDTTLDITGVTHIKNTEPSILSNSSGALIVDGGVTVLNNMNVSGPIFVSDTSNTNSLVVSGAILVGNGINAVNSSNGGSLSVNGGASITQDVYIGQNLYSKNIRLNTTEDSVNLSSGSIITTGGVTIASTRNSVNASNGGALTVAGGAGVSKDFYVGESTYINNNLTVLGTSKIQDLNYIKNGLITNVDCVTGEWIFLGIISSFVSANISKTYFILENGEFRHYKSGEHIDSSIIVYSDNGINKLFIKCNASSTLSINVYKSSEQLSINREGTGINPNGAFSNLSTFTQIYNTSINKSDLGLSIGNFVQNGTSASFGDTTPIIGINQNTTGNLGLLFNRFQNDNDVSLGDVITDSATETGSLPDQSTVSNIQTKLSSLQNINDDYYNGWWILITSGPNQGQVRKIISYNGSQRVATISSQWTNQHPSEFDTFSLFNKSFQSIYFNSIDKEFELVSISNKTDFKISDYTNLKLGILKIYNTSSSTNSSSGGIITAGGVTINNTSDSINTSNGGALTVAGGASINKNLLIGKFVGINTTNPSDSLHIKQGDIRLENSNINFLNYSISNTNNILSINNSSGKSALSVTSSGNVGINCTSDIASPLTINANNFISSNNSTGYLGLIGGNTNINDNMIASRIILNGNGQGSSGNLELHSGNNANVQIINNNNVSIDVNNNNIVNVLSTASANSMTSGALIVSGGVSIKTTENSSFTSGGALAVNGGANIKKDIYIGGNIYVNGSLNAAGGVTNPILTFVNPVNCSVTGYYNASMLNISSETILSFSVSLIPNSTDSKCSIELILPNRTSSLALRSDVIATCSGYTDDINVIPLFNTLCVGIANTTNALITFQPSSLATHFIDIIIRYSIV